MLSHSPVVLGRAPLILMTALALLVVVAAGCGGGEEAGPSTSPASSTTAPVTTEATTTTQAPTTTEAAATTEAPEPFAMGIALAPGVGDAVEVPVLAGAERVQAEYPAEVSLAGSEDRAADLRTLAAGSDLVVVIGPDYDQPLAQVASEYPDVTFVRLEGFADAPNVVSATFSMREAAFLVGAAAALSSDTGRVAFLGAMPIPSVARLEAGFQAGALAADPAVEVTVEYLGEPGQWSFFSDPAAAKAAALDLYGTGIDVIFHGAAASGAGVFDAAAETRAAGTNVWAIGVDYDEAASAEAEVAPVILTSAVYDYEAAVVWAAGEFVAHRLMGGEVGIGVAQGAVGYTTTGGWLDPIRAELETFAGAIADGSITVPHEP